MSAGLIAPFVLGAVVALGWTTLLLDTGYDRLAVVAFAVMPLLNVASANVSNWFRGRLETRSFTLIRVSQAAVWLASTAGLSLTGHLTVGTAALSLSISMFVSTLVSVVLALRASLLTRRIRRESAAKSPPSVFVSNRDWRSATGPCTWTS